VNDQFLVEIGPAADAGTAAGTAAGTGRDGEAVLDPAVGLLELNRLFGAWVEQVYHRAWHSETGQTPLGRWAAGWGEQLPAQPSAEALSEAFLWETARTVRKNATVSLHSNTYQVEDILVGRKVELVFDPFDLTRIQVRHQGRPMGLAVPYRITRHSHPRARPETAPLDPPASTGINYLDLIVTAHEEHLQAGVNYAALTTTTVEPDATQLRLQAELDGFAALTRAGGHDLPGHDLPGPGTSEHDQQILPEQIPGQLDLTALLPEHETTSQEKA
jgi:putative transposase